ncbi:hypothetical protein Tco_1029327 [Tanacetum coccineum]|uniref:Reverse transcriptase domain-containing protein n=1 Tax=Tanacetum coccineum TaxID=301880 RepID=A0ABQ5G3B9_9ASTR
MKMLVQMFFAYSFPIGDGEEESDLLKIGFKVWIPMYEDDIAKELIVRHTMRVHYGVQFPVIIYLWKKKIPGSDLENTSWESKRVTTPPQVKLLPKLIGFDYEIRYNKGIENVAADALSRLSNTGEFLQMIVQKLQSGNTVKHYQWSAQQLLRKGKLGASYLEKNGGTSLLEEDEKGAPPAHVTYTTGDNANDSVDRSLVAREAAIQLLKFHLQRAQDRMKTMADKKRTERVFGITDLILLKLQPYRQSTLRQHKHHKLAPKYYGPFKIVSRWWTNKGVDDATWELYDDIAESVSPRLAFDNALKAFNVKMEIELLSNPSEIAAPILMKKLTDIYFTSVTQMAESTFPLSPRQMALWQSQMEDHTSDWLRVVPISGLGQTTIGSLWGIFMGTMLCHVLFIVGTPNNRHKWGGNTLVDICYRSGISSVGGERNKSLRPADVLLYSWDVRRDVCVDLTGSSPLTQTGMVDFVPGRAVAEATQRKRVKYEAKCADIRYDFLPFLFSSFGELEKDAVTLLKRIQKFYMAQDIGARAAVHIFNRINREVMLREVRLRCPAISRWVGFCYSYPSRLYYGEHTLWSCQGVQQGDPLGPLLFSLVLHPLICMKVMGPGCGLHLNVDKTKVFWPKEDPRSRLAGIPLFSISKPCSACSRVFAGDIYGDRIVSCAGIIGIKHRHNIVCDTLVDICYRSGISVGKEVDIGLDGGCDKPLRPADMLLYSWDGGLDVCVDLTGSSPLTQTGMVDFVSGRAVIDVAQRKRGKYMTKCAAIGYGFLPFSFSSLGELEACAVTLLKRIRKFFITQDIGAHAAVHIFNRISFAVAKGVWAQITGMADFVHGRAMIDAAQRNLVSIWLKLLQILDMVPSFFCSLLRGISGMRDGYFAVSGSSRRFSIGSRLLGTS